MHGLCDENVHNADEDQRSTNRGGRLPRRSGLDFGRASDFDCALMYDDLSSKQWKENHMLTIDEKSGQMDLAKTFGHWILIKSRTF